MSPLVRSPLTIEHALLGFLREGALHGYEIHRRLLEPTGLGQVWSIKQAHLYSLMSRLEQDGYLTSTLKTQVARPPRKLFRLTQTGNGAFLDWVQTPVAHGRDLRLDFLTKYYFAQREGAACVARLIKRQRIACQDWLQAQQTLAGAHSNRNAYEWQVCQFRIGQIEAMLAWLDLCEKMQPVARREQ